VTTAWTDDRAAALDHIRVWLRHWGATTGPDHAAARREAQAALRYWRTYHLRPAAISKPRAVRPQSIVRERYVAAWHEKQRLNR
jgi:hypothetical protein